MLATYSATTIETRCRRSWTPLWSLLSTSRRGMRGNRTTRARTCSPQRLGRRWQRVCRSRSTILTSALTTSPNFSRCWTIAARRSILRPRIASACTQCWRTCRRRHRRCAHCSSLRWSARVSWHWHTSPSVPRSLPPRPAATLSVRRPTPRTSASTRGRYRSRRRSRVRCRLSATPCRRQTTTRSSSRAQSGWHRLLSRAFSPRNLANLAACNSTARFARSLAPSPRLLAAACATASPDSRRLPQCSTSSALRRSSTTGATTRAPSRGG
mmetsp:Transcript_11397/g.47745  ORF Transcript_11397/g.47745 Transcript_11397/m.47745 type:complete len:269 (+) Transcript_11397:789-1595(+)